MKSIFSEEGGKGKGVHSACSARRATLGFSEMKQFSMLDFVVISLYPSVHDVNPLPTTVSYG